MSVASPPTVSAPEPENVIVPTVTGSSTVTSSAVVFRNTHVSSAVNAADSTPQFAGLENFPSPAPPVHMYVAAGHADATSVAAIAIMLFKRILISFLGRFNQLSLRDQRRKMTVPQEYTSLRPVPSLRTLNAFCFVSSSTRNCALSGGSSATPSVTAHVTM